MSIGRPADEEDLKLKIIQQEGRDQHDFNIFDDRSALLWRKPYLDGAVSELTSGQPRTPEQLRQAIEQIMLRADKGRNPRVVVATHPARRAQGRVRLDWDVDRTRQEQAYVQPADQVLRHWRPPCHLAVPVAQLPVLDPGTPRRARVPWPLLPWAVRRRSSPGGESVLCGSGVRNCLACM